MLIYFDTCALNRLSDTSSSKRIQDEADAVDRLFKLIAMGRLDWVASTVVQYELERNPYPIRRIDTLKLLDLASRRVAPSPNCRHRAEVLTQLGYRGLDALHLAVAEMAGADRLLTTDDRFLSRAFKNIGAPRTEVLNPIDLVQRRYPWLIPSPSPK